MSIFISFSTLLRLEFWLAVLSVVVGIALGDHGMPKGGTAPETAVTPAAPVVAAGGVNGR